MEVVIFVAGRPPSPGWAPRFEKLAWLARDMYSVVRDSRMWCPHDIGRDSWVWGEQETLYNIISPHEVGEEAVTDVSRCREENGVARGCK